MSEQEQEELKRLLDQALAPFMKQFQTPEQQQKQEQVDQQEQQASASSTPDPEALASNPADCFSTYLNGSIPAITRDEFIHGVDQTLQKLKLQGQLPRPWFDVNQPFNVIFTIRLEDSEENNLPNFKEHINDTRPRIWHHFMIKSSFRSYKARTVTCLAPWEVFASLNNLVPVQFIDVAKNTIAHPQDHDEKLTVKQDEGWELF